MSEVLLAASRMGIVIPSFITLVVFLAGANRVWKQTRKIKSVLQYSWEHADTAIIGFGLTGGYLLLIYFQQFLPANKATSAALNTVICLSIAASLKGSLVGFIRNFWSVHGTKRNKPPTKNLNPTLIQSN
jgi:hypothetical protein